VNLALQRRSCTSALRRTITIQRVVYINIGMGPESTKRFHFEIALCPFRSGTLHVKCHGVFAILIFFLVPQSHREYMFEQDSHPLKNSTTIMSIFYMFYTYILLCQVASQKHDLVTTILYFHNHNHSPHANHGSHSLSTKNTQCTRITSQASLYHSMSFS
jgi:hypothetical protein